MTASFSAHLWCLHSCHLCRILWEHTAIMPYPYRYIAVYFVIVLFAIACNKTVNPVNTGNTGNTGGDSSTSTPLKITITSIQPTDGPYKTIDTITGLGLE